MELTKQEQPYIENQKALANIYSHVAYQFNIPPIDPTSGYVINIGCGSSPDQIALQVFKDKGINESLGVVGVDIALDDYGKKEAATHIQPGDKVELVGGDAAKEIPRIVDENGKPNIIVARNPDAMFITPKGNTNPLLETSWKSVFQSAYQALPEGESFIVITYKNRQEWVPLVAYLGEAGFVPVSIQKPNNKTNWEKIKSLFDIETWLPQPKVEPDQFVIVGVKNPSKKLLSELTHNGEPLTSETLDKLRTEAEAEKQEIATGIKYNKVNKYFRNQLQADAVDVLMEYLYRMELDIDPDEIESLKALKNTSAKLIINVSGAEDAFGFEKNTGRREPIKETFLKRGDLGHVKSVLAKEPGISIGRVTNFDFPDARTDQSNLTLTQDGGVVKSEVVRIFVSPEKLETLQKIIKLKKENMSDSQDQTFGK